MGGKDALVPESAIIKRQGDRLSLRGMAYSASINTVLRISVHMFCKKAHSPILSRHQSHEPPPDTDGGKPKIIFIITRNVGAYCIGGRAIKRDSNMATSFEHLFENSCVFTLIIRVLDVE